MALSRLGNIIGRARLVSGATVLGAGALGLAWVRFALDLVVVGALQRAGRQHAADALPERVQLAPSERLAGTLAPGLLGAGRLVRLVGAHVGAANCCAGVQ